MKAIEFYTKIASLVDLFNEQNRETTSFHASFYSGLFIRPKEQYMPQENELFLFIKNYYLPPNFRNLFGQIQFIGDIIYDQNLGVFANLDEDNICVNLDTNMVTLNEYETNFEMMVCAENPEYFLDVLYIMANVTSKFLTKSVNKIDKIEYASILTDASGNSSAEKFYKFILGI